MRGWRRKEANGIPALEQAIPFAHFLDAFFTPYFGSKLKGCAVESPGPMTETSYIQSPTRLAQKPETWVRTDLSYGNKNEISNETVQKSLENAIVSYPNDILVDGKVHSY